MESFLRQKFPWEEIQMKKLILALVFSAAAVAPALADDTYSLVKDTVGNCSAAVTSTEYPGMTIVGDKTYSSMQDANKALDDVKDCDGLVR
jgi:hypothetical protein